MKEITETYKANLARAAAYVPVWSRDLNSVKPSQSSSPYSKGCFSCEHVKGPLQKEALFSTMHVYTWEGWDEDDEEAHPGNLLASAVFQMNGGPWLDYAPNNYFKTMLNLNHNFGYYNTDIITVGSLTIEDLPVSLYYIPASGNFRHFNNKIDFSGIIENAGYEGEELYLTFVSHNGQHGHYYDPRSDVYNVGVVGSAYRFKSQSVADSVFSHMPGQQTGSGPVLNRIMPPEKPFKSPAQKKKQPAWMAHYATMTNDPINGPPPEAWTEDYS